MIYVAVSLTTTGYDGKYLEYVQNKLTDYFNQGIEMKNKLTLFNLVWMFTTIGLLCACQETGASSVSQTITSTASFTQGLATTTKANLFPSGGRIAAMGEIKDQDGILWTLPAVVRFNDQSMPFASDLYNNYAHEFAETKKATAALDSNKVIEIDADGELITAYIFADNYFEIYVNGIAVGKDPVPFTQFNSNIVQFKASSPFTVSMLLVDWEED